MRNNLRQAAAKVRRLKDVFENAANVYPSPFVSVKAQRAVTKIQRPNIVEAENVVGVTMRYQDRIEMLQSLTQGLLTKVSRSIDNYGLTRVFDEDRYAQTLITWIVRGAGLAIACDRRNSG
jgi:hypothetical protein